MIKITRSNLIRKFVNLFAVGTIQMSEYENVVVGKLRLKGKPLDVKAGGCTKKKKHKRNFEHIFSGNHHSGL